MARGFPRHTAPRKSAASFPPRMAHAFESSKERAFVSWPTYSQHSAGTKPETITKHATRLRLTITTPPATHHPVIACHSREKTALATGGERRRSNSNQAPHWRTGHFESGSTQRQAHRDASAKPLVWERHDAATDPPPSSLLFQPPTVSQNERTSTAYQKDMTTNSPPRTP